MQGAPQACGAQAEFGVFYGIKGRGGWGGQEHKVLQVGTSMHRGYMHGTARHTWGDRAHVWGAGAHACVPPGMLSAALLTKAREGPRRPSP